MGVINESLVPRRNKLLEALARMASPPRLRRLLVLTGRAPQAA
ncbi:hypothetical protein ACUXZZ_44820 [Streptomyces graminifolii]